MRPEIYPVQDTFNPMNLYGIANCDSVRKTRRWLEEHGIAYQFHDFKKHGIAPQQAQLWLQQAGWESLMNRKGLTWRGLSEEQKKSVSNNASALPLLLENPSLIKRPLLEQDGRLLHIGFDQATLEKIFHITT